MKPLKANEANTIINAVLESAGAELATVACLVLRFFCGLLTDGFSISVACSCVTGVWDSYKRDSRRETTPKPKLIVAATAVVALIPSAGINTKPVAAAPKTAPKVLSA